MKVLFLCAGYATRLYPLTLDKPKPLLPIGGKPILDYLLEKVEKIPEVDEVYVVTNQKFASNFENWAAKKKLRFQVRVFNDRTLTNETRLGAVGDMQFVIEEAKLNDDLLVIAGDNLFEFDLNDFVKKAKQKGILIAARYIENLEDMKRYGEIEKDEDGKIIYLKEKPEKPRSHLAASCVYFFKKESLSYIKKYLDEGNNPDQPGRYIEWLYKKVPVFVYEFREKWYDIGNMDQYKKADEEYSRRRNEKI
ncbi:MAG: nucleotidyltransferase family protein [Elusimicrobia bacterium]|nr:nucleotidyltransferase family protein [Elusimicrobiota bacterium]